MLKPIAVATALAGTLDILFAMLLVLLHGHEPTSMLRHIASGPFPAAKQWGWRGAILGVIVHFTLIGIMATVYVAASRREPRLAESPLKWGVIYGLVTYVVMNLLVVPIRFPAMFPPKPISVLNQLFAHIVLVGMPISFITSKWTRIIETWHASSRS